MGADDYTLQSFATCKNSNGDMIGTQYTVSDDNGNEVELAAIGEMTGDCRSL